MPLEPIQFRVNKTTAQRLELLIPYVSDHTEVGSLKDKVTKSDVARIALDLGLEMMKKRYEAAQLEGGNPYMPRGG